MYEAVRKHGVYERWRGRKRQYWYAGDGFKYWVMTSNVAQSRILIALASMNRLRRPIRNRNSLNLSRDHGLRRSDAPQVDASRLCRLFPGQL
jgi:hypothetical protein